MDLESMLYIIVYICYGLFLLKIIDLQKVRLLIIYILINSVNLYKHIYNIVS